ncbi:hypothetical protein FRC03_010115 [Tulasnella sp. 419]|nr:hypothetical protein FRC03_010115 [Tulasnella sp. 419]
MEPLPPSYTAARLDAFRRVDPPPAPPPEDTNNDDPYLPPYETLAEFAEVLPHHPLISTNPEFATFYPVGKRKHVHALVHPLDLEDHLTLLRAFHQMKEDILISVDATTLSPEDIWDVFLAKAVRRFELWIKDAVGFTPRNATEEKPAPFQEHEIPPLDVIMVWHTYLLNPRVYYEDGLRINKAFLLLRAVFPLHHIASTAFRSPTPTRVNYFQTQTKEAFDQPPFREDDAVVLRCPGCKEENRVFWYKRDGTGYAQKGFKRPCSKCSVSLTHETLGIAKIASDLAKVHEDPRNNTMATLLLRPRTGMPNLGFARFWNAGVLHSLQRFKPEEYTKVLEWNFDAAVHVLRAGYNNPLNTLLSNKNSIKRLVKAYNTRTSFSIDLIAAVKRQFRFVTKIAELGWLDERAFPADSKGHDGKEESKALRRCVNQYHAFLDLMSANPKTFLVPTLGIDLAWHTHQLFHTHYRMTSIDLLGLLVDHDDAVEQETIATSYDETAELWHARYHLPYSVCGCPQPQTSLTSVFASKILKTPFSSSSSKDPRLPDLRPDLLHVSETTLNETHPSEHSSVAVKNISEIKKLKEKRVESLESASKKSKGKGRSMAGSAVDAWVDDKDVLKVKREEHRVDSPAFYLGLFTEEGAEVDGVLNGSDLGVADCVMGMGIHGTCQAGNWKQQPQVSRPLGGCGGMVACGGGGY